eukprot:snap_masked-scaffold_19-processed-gene-3.39-mRNA-1 protein AED:1.00 eAED:1.00 QI:0/0/0/0/1/1/2/0/149
MITFGEFDDSSRLKFCTFVAINPLGVGSRMLMKTCLIKGISGPSKRISTLNKQTLIKTTQLPVEETSSSPNSLSKGSQESEKTLSPTTPDFLVPSPSSKRLQFLSSTRLENKFGFSREKVLSFMLYNYTNFLYIIFTIIEVWFNHSYEI